MRRRLAAGEVEHAHALALGQELENRPRHAQLGIVGMRGDDEDVEHGVHARFVGQRSTDRITGWRRIDRIGIESHPVNPADPVILSIHFDNPIMVANDSEVYRSLCAHARETALLASIRGLLEWDERTKMPRAAGAHCADQLAYLAGEIHRRQTAPQVGDWLAQLAESPLAADPLSDSGTVIRELRRQFDKKTRLPQSLVEELSRAATLGEQTWVEARKANDFAMFRPRLERMLELKRQEAAALGYTTTPYDPLLDDYEPHATTAEVSAVLAALRDALAPLVQEIMATGRQPDVSVLQREFPIDVQESFGKEISAAMGFNYDAGRLDTTTHPFCGGAGPGDVRITTRYNVRDFGDAFFSILHEAGHGMYEQGLPREHFGLPTGEAVSLGIHESQSRMWENQVGRSRAFWEHVLPRAEARSRRRSATRRSTTSTRRSTSCSRRSSAWTPTR